MFSVAWVILLLILVIGLASARRCSNEGCKCLQWCTCAGSACCQGKSLWGAEGMTNREKTVILYTRPDCVYCVQFKSIWEDLQRALIPHGYQFVEYNGQLVPSPDVKTYPTLFLIDNLGRKHRFDGTRTFDNIRNWVLAPRR